MAPPGRPALLHVLHGWGGGADSLTLTDAVSGASITVKGFLELCAEALKAAK